MDKSMVLRDNKNFRRLYSRGKSFVSPALVTYVLKNRKGYLRVGITASKKVGNAVQRNRSRRVIREAYKTISPFKGTSYDVVFVARKKTAYVKTQDIIKDMEFHLKTAGLIKKTN